MRPTNDSYLLSIPIERFAFTLEDVQDEIRTCVPQRNSWVVITLNLHAISLMKEDQVLREAYKGADRIVFDGMSAIWLARLTTGKCVEKISHQFLMEALYQEGEQNNWSFYFLGGPKGAAHKASEKVKASFPNVNIVGTNHGYFGKKEEQKLIKEINDLSPDVLAVGLGMPAQEKWIHSNKRKLNVGMITNCGGYIEQVAKKDIHYFPDWTYKYNLCWLYRIIKEPRRLWKRYLFEGIVFLPIFLKGLFEYLQRSLHKLMSKD